MNASDHAMTVADDATITDMMTQAQRRLIIVAPGLSKKLAEIVAVQWRRLGVDTVNITLDVDPEVCRLGYGEFAGLSLLADVAKALGTTLNRHSGVRIGIIISDDDTLIYSPTPLNIEAGPSANGNSQIKPNAIRVGLPPADLERDLGAGPDGAKERTIGLDPADSTQIKAVEADLVARPPMPFDLSRRLRVYNAHLEFVELRLLGCKVNRRTIKIPPDLVGFADGKTRKLLMSSFRILGEDDAGVWGEELFRLKNAIVDRFFVLIPSYGHVIRIRDKAKFERAIAALRNMLDRARDRKCATLQAAIDQRLDALVAALTPAVAAHPPERWSQSPVHGDLSRLLRYELVEIAGTAREMLESARVQVRYKGVTYDTLQNPRFVSAVKKAMPDLPVLHDEADAVCSQGL